MFYGRVPIDLSGSRDRIPRESGREGTLDVLLSSVIEGCSEGARPSKPVPLPSKFIHVDLPMWNHKVYEVEESNLGRVSRRGKVGTTGRRDESQGLGFPLTVGDGRHLSEVGEIGETTRSSKSLRYSEEVRLG